MRRDAGFTLVELIVVISITAVLASFSVGLISGPALAYRDTARRAALVDSASSTLERMARDVRRALPNSVRIDGSGQVLELYHAVEGARYRTGAGTNPGPVPHTAPSDTLEFTGDTSFNLLGRFGALAFTYGVPLPVGHRVAVYTTSTQVWSDAATSADPGVITPATTSVTVLLDSDEDQVALSAPHTFQLASPAKRVFVVDTPITLRCSLGDGTLVRHWGYAPTAAQPTDPLLPPLSAGSDALLARRVTGCAFTYDPGTSTRAALVTLDLALSEDGETVRLLHQVHVENPP